jgi:hypothetical protein
VSAHRDKSKQPLSVRVVQDWEKRISEQMLLIADLEVRGQVTIGAEGELKDYQAFLNKLRNHRETMKELMTPDPHKQRRSKRRRFIET